MFTMFSCVKFMPIISILWAAYGSLRDMFFISLLYLAVFVIHIFTAPPTVVLAVMTLCIVFILLLTIIDTLFFCIYSSRIDFAVIQNLNFISIFANITLKYLLLSFPCIILLFVCTYSIYMSMQTLTMGSPLLYIALITAFLGAFCFFTKKIPDFTNAKFYSVGLQDIYDSVVRTAVRYNTEHVLSSALWNFVSVLYSFKSRTLLTHIEFTKEQKQFFEQAGLHGEFRSREPLENLPQKSYKRIIILTLESISLRYLHKYNIAIPPETTPFLNLLCKKYTVFDNFYCSITPTINAMYALLSSRLDILEGKPYHDAKYETLFSSLRNQGYASHVLRGTTKEYGNHAQFYPRAYKCDSLLAYEEILQNYPDGVKNGWGFSDPVVYKQAIDVLNTHKDGKVCLLINTIDTHPPYGYSFSEDIFPDILHKTPSRLLRSLYQMDIELMHFYLKLEENNLLDADTLFFIMGDHTPGYGPEYREITGAHDFFPGKVPLLCVTQEHNVFQLIDPSILSCSLDFYPTLCDAFHLPIPKSAWGESLFRQGKHAIIQRQNELFRFMNTEKTFPLNLNAHTHTFEEDALITWLNNARLC